MKNKYLSLAIAAVMFMVLPMIAQAEKLGFDSLNLSAHGHSADCLHAWSPPDLSIQATAGDVPAEGMSVAGTLIDGIVVSVGSPLADHAKANSVYLESCQNCKPVASASLIHEVGWRSDHTDI